MSKLSRFLRPMDLYLLHTTIVHLRRFYPYSRVFSYEIAKFQNIIWKDNGGLGFGKIATVVFYWKVWNVHCI